MLFPRSHAWTLRQKWLIVVGCTLALLALGAAIYTYEQYFRSPSDEVLFGTWEWPDSSSDARLCYRFDRDHTFYIGGCGESEQVMRGRWYAGGSNIYLSIHSEADSLLQFKRPVILHIADIQPDTLRLSMWRGQPAETYRRFRARSDPSHLTNR